MSNLNIESRLHKFREEMDKDLNVQRSIRRDLRHNHLKNLGNDYSGMSQCHSTQGQYHTLAFLGDLVKIGGLALGSDLSAIADVCSKGSGVLTKFTDGSLTRLQGHLEELRDLLADEGKREDEIRRLLQEINQILDAAMEKASRSKSSPFNGG